MKFEGLKGPYMWPKATSPPQDLEVWPPQEAKSSSIYKYFPQNNFMRGDPFDFFKNIYILEVRGAMRPSFQLLQRAGGLRPPNGGPSGPLGALRAPWTKTNKYIAQTQILIHIQHKQKYNIGCRTNTTTEDKFVTEQQQQQQQQEQQEQYETYL